MIAKLSTTHDRITLVVRDGKTADLRLTWGRSGERVSGKGVTRETVKAALRAMTCPPAETIGSWSEALRVRAAAAPDLPAFVAGF